jgi:hypothetical protein
MDRNINNAETAKGVVDTEKLAIVGTAMLAFALIRLFI